MEGSWGTAALLSFAAFSLLTPSALALGASGEFVSATPILLNGAVQMSSSDMGIATASPETYALDISRGFLRVTTATQHVLVTRDGVERRLGSERSAVEIDLSGATALLVPEDGFRAVLRAARASVSVSGHALDPETVRFPAHSDARIVTPSGIAFDARAGSDSLRAAFPAGASALEADGVAVSDGRFHVLLSQARVLVQRDDGVERIDVFRLVRNEAAPPTGLALLGEPLDASEGFQALAKTERFATLVVEEGRARLSGALLAYAEAPVYRVHGTGFFPGVTGTLSVAQRHELRGESLMAGGDFALEQDRHVGGNPRFRMQGEVSYLTIGDSPVALAAKGAPLAALALLAVLGYFWPLVRDSVGRGVLLPLYSHIRPGEALDNATRDRLYRLVKTDPGVSASDLSSRAGVSWGTTIYHLDVLEQQHMIVSLRDGRYRRYFENGGVHNGRKQAIAALKNPTSSLVARNILASPGVTQKALAASLNMSPQALHWHLCRLAEAGLIDRRRDGRCVRHFVSGDAAGPIVG